MLNYLFINLLIVYAFYGLFVDVKMKYRLQLLIILAVVALLYNVVTVRESFADFSQTDRASLDIFSSPPSRSDNLKDKCGQCDGLCVEGATGRNFPPSANPLCRHHSHFKGESGVYMIRSLGKYLTYDLQNPTHLFLVEEAPVPDLQWKIEKYGERVRICTVNKPHLYLYANNNNRLAMTYIPVSEWSLLNSHDGVLIQSTSPATLYLTTDGKNVTLGSFLHHWQLVSKEHYDNINLLNFPDTHGTSTGKETMKGGLIGEWSKYYSEFWNGEYIYKNTTPTNKDYLTVHLLPDGTGTISIKKETWNVLSISPELLYGENKNSYIYLEMLTAEKGGKFYDPNRPQVKILTKDKNSLRPQYATLVSSDANNLNTYSYKVGDVGENVKCYKETYDNMPPIGLHYLGSGYNLPTIDLNIKKPCLLAVPKTAPVNTGYWSVIDKTGKLKTKTFGPMEVAYTYLYECVDGTTEESPRSPSLQMKTSVGAGGAYYGAAVYVAGQADAKYVRIYVKGDGDKDLRMMQELPGKTGQIEVVIIPKAVEDALAR